MQNSKRNINLQSSRSSKSFCFTYLKFECYDVNSTIEFYRTLGLQVQFKQDIRTNFSTLTMFTMYYAASPSMFLTFIRNPEKSFKEHNKTLQHPEYLLIYIKKIESITALLKAKFNCLLPATDLSATKLAIFIDPNGLQVRLQELSDLSMEEAPSKISHHTTEWNGRVGSFFMPSKDAHSSLDMYSNLFTYTKTEEEESAVQDYDDYLPLESNKNIRGKKSVRSNRSLTLRRASQKDLKHLKTKDVAVKRMDLLDESIMQRLKLATSKLSGLDYANREVATSLEGFKLVDIEDFMIGLCRYLNIWMGNGSRSYYSSVCFTERIDAGNITLSNNIDFDTVRRQSNLLAFGFQVDHIDNASERLLARGKNIRTDDEREYIHNFGIIEKFHDEFHDLKFEIFCTKETYEATAKRGDRLLEFIKKEVRRSEKEKKPIEPILEAAKHYDNHLRGTNFHISLGALDCKNESSSFKKNTTDEAKSIQLKKSGTSIGRSVDFKLPPIVKNKKIPSKVMFGSSTF